MNFINSNHLHQPIRTLGNILESFISLHFANISILLKFFDLMNKKLLTNIKKHNNRKTPYRGEQMMLE